MHEKLGNKTMAYTDKTCAYIITTDQNMVKGNNWQFTNVLSINNMQACECM